MRLRSLRLRRRLWRRSRRRASRVARRSRSLWWAATSPASLSVEDLDTEAVAREREVLIQQAKSSGKPQEIAEKMVEGRMNKYYQEVVLLEQTSVIDGETRIADVIANAAKEAGVDIALKAFVRFNLGEGVEKEESDFASEVAAQLA